MMGIVRTDISSIESAPNLHLLGQIPHPELPAHLLHSDVLLLPYVRTKYSFYMNPAKLHECLAVGRPTVATSLPEFEEYRHVLRVAETIEQFEQCTQDAVREGVDTAQTAKRRARARENTWDARLSEINAILERRMN
jgi:hypothetical protein